MSSHYGFTMQCIVLLLTIASTEPRKQCSGYLAIINLEVLWMTQNNFSWIQAGLPVERKCTGMADFHVTGLKQKMKGKSTILTRKIHFWKIIFFQLLYSLKQLALNSGSHVCSKHISTSGIRQLKKVPRSPPNSPNSPNSTNSTSMASAGAPWTTWTTTQRKWDLVTWPGLELLRRNDGLVLVMPAFPGVELRNLRKIRAWDRGWPHVVGMTGAHGIIMYIYSY